VKIINILSLLHLLPYNKNKFTIVHNQFRMQGNNHKTFKRLRKKYPLMIYESFNWQVNNSTLFITYHFNISGKYDFFPKYEIPLGEAGITAFKETFIDNMVFHIGMVELISYWKLTCSPVILIKPFWINADQQIWWRKLYFLGLGEFFYLNGIDVDEHSILDFEFEKRPFLLRKNFLLNSANGVLIPVGGGKDSLASLSILSDYQHSLMAFAINPGMATEESVKIAGLGNNFLRVKRILDPLLVSLNSKGFLNGHTPFSALVAFVSSFVGCLHGYRFVALSNEASANEATIPGTNINHQYSKSFDFENDFRRYMSNYVTLHVEYFSLLRPLNELQIAAVFSQNPEFFKVFRSCNVGSKTNSWCCNCPKCLFTYIMLSPFLDPNTLVCIFGENLLEKESLVPLLDQLTGVASEKPFECIGTIEEVNSALAYLCTQYPSKELPVLLKHHNRVTGSIRFLDISDQFNAWNECHNLHKPFLALLKEKLAKANIPH
jgi:hypothetical protein